MTSENPPIFSTMLENIEIPSNVNEGTISDHQEEIDHMPEKAQCSSRILTHKKSQQ
jgi:hypothetical protein